MRCAAGALLLVRKTNPAQPRAQYNVLCTRVGGCSTSREGTFASLCSEDLNCTEVWCSFFRPWVRQPLISLISFVLEAAPAPPADPTPPSTAHKRLKQSEQTCCKNFCCMRGGLITTDSRIIPVIRKQKTDLILLKSDLLQTAQHLASNPSCRLTRDRLLFP